MGINIVKVVSVIHKKPTPFKTALTKSLPKKKWVQVQNMNKGIQKHYFSTACMMAILYPLKTSIFSGWALVRKNFGKNILEFVIFIFVA